MAAFQVPKCSITVCGCTRASGSSANSRIVGERPRRSAEARSSSRISSSSNGAACRRETPRAPPRRSARRARLRDAWSSHIAISLERFEKSASSSEHSTFSATRYPRPCVDVAPARLETIAAARRRAALARGRPRRRHDACPGKLLWKLDPVAVDALAGPARRTASRSSPRRTARPRRPRWRRGSSARASGWRGIAPARTCSPGSRPLCSAPTGPSSGSSRSTRPHFRRRSRERGRARYPLGNLFRDQLDRYGELELVAERWREAVRGLPDRRRRSSSTRTTRWSATSRRAGVRCFATASTTRGMRGPPCSTRPTRSTASAAARRTSTTPRTSATSASTAARPAVTRAPRSTSSRGTSS